MMKIMYCEWAFCPCQIECPHPSYMLSCGQPKASHPSTAPAAWCPGISLNCHTVYCPDHIVSHCLLPWLHCVTLSTAFVCVVPTHPASLPSAVPNQSVFARACSCYQFLSRACSCYQFVARACSCYQFVARACSCKPLCCTGLQLQATVLHTTTLFD